jgi:hypothetical protein
VTPRRRYARHDNISVYMPLLLSNGLSITSIAVTCSNCAGRIPNDYVRGEVRGPAIADTEWLQADYSVPLRPRRGLRRMVK